MQERPLDSFSVIGGTARLNNWQFHRGTAGHLQWYKKRSDGRTHAFFVHTIIEEWCLGEIMANSGGIKFTVSLQSVCGRIIADMPLGRWDGRQEPYDPICPTCQKMILFKEMGGKL